MHTTTHQIRIQHQTPLTRSTLSTVKKVAMDPVGRVLMLRISPRANTLSLKLGRRYWNSREGGRDFCTWEDASAAGTSYTENYSLISHARNFPRVEYFRRVTWRDTRVSAACFRLRGIIQISTALPQRIYRRKLGPV